MGESSASIIESQAFKRGGLLNRRVKHPAGKNPDTIIDIQTSNFNDSNIKVRPLTGRPGKDQF